MITWYARNDVPYSGGEKQLSITFPYIKKEHIKVFVNDVETTAYHFLNESQIFLDCSLKKGDMMSVRRNTPIDEKMVNFTNTSILNAEKQNLAQTQLLNSVQEIYDNNIEFKDETTAQVAAFEARVAEVEATTAESANIVAENAVLASTAKTNSEQAVSTANSASDTATEALLTSEQANSYATEARDSATIALDIATTSSNKVDVFEESIETVLEAADKITVLEGAVGEATEAAQAAQEAVQAVGEMIDAIDGKANVDLDNLSEAGQAKLDEKANAVDVLDKSQITNCLLEVPQNIKLELNNGVLTLKAGSKVIVPNGKDSNGNNIFNEYVVPNDLSVGASSLSTAERGVVLLNGGIVLIHWASNKSGTSPTTQGFYYHTGENKFYRDGVAQTNFSFPIMMGNYTTQYGFNNITQVFNGMGYFGSTIWVDKGVKGLIPNGRNEDGTLNNIEFTTSQVVLSDRAALDGENRGFFFNNTTNKLQDKAYSVEEKIIAGTGAYVFNPETNNIYDSGGTSGRFILCGYYSSTDGVITSFQPKQPFRAVNYNDYRTEVDSKVSKSGDTMTGDLTISTHTVPELYLQSTNFDYTSTTAPSSTTAIGRVVALDKNKKTTGCFQNLIDTAGSYITQIYTRRSVGGKEINGVMSVGVKTDGTIFTQAPTPATGDNSTKIATTAYCVNRRCTAKATTTSSASTTRPAWIVQNYVNGTSWYRVWSDGWIEQGGRVDSPGSSFVVTFLKAFTNTQYNILCQIYSKDNDTGGFGSVVGVTNGASFANLTKTSFKVSSVSSGGFYWRACGY